MKRRAEGKGHLVVSNDAPEVDRRTEVDGPEPSDEAAAARSLVARRARQLGLEALIDDAAMIASELVTNAVLHGGGVRGVTVTGGPSGLRVEVRDANQTPPVVGWAADHSMTGRGLRLVGAMASRWGARPELGGKVVWAEVAAAAEPGALDSAALLSEWDDKSFADLRLPRYRVELGDVPTGLLLAAKSHVDNLVREFSLAATGARAGSTAEIPPHLATLIETVTGRFAEARLSIKYQALKALHGGLTHTRLQLDLTADAADAALDYLNALDEVDGYCRAMRLLTLETPPQHRVFRHWYIEELINQVHSAAAGRPPRPPQPFEERLLKELDEVARAQWASSARRSPLPSGPSPGDRHVPRGGGPAVITEGRAALGAAGSGLLLATEANQLSVPATVGYDEGVVARLRSESPDAVLPATVALRTGVAVWLESRHECQSRFPELADLEATTVALCAVPLTIGDRQLGALRFSFTEPHLFDDDERQFVLALAAQTAQALDRAQLQQSRINISRRLQRSLLPPTLPNIPGVDVAALYHPFGDEMDVGGDFYDVWSLTPGHWAIAIGDASGTGPEAAALTALVRYTLRALTMSDLHPESVLRSLNQALLAHRQGVDDERFCTVILGILTVSNGIVLDIASGGHPYPIKRHTDGSMRTISLGGSLLGQLDDIEVAHRQVALEPGEVILLFTDGVIESRDGGTFFDTAGIRAVLAEAHPSAEAIVRSLGERVVAFSGGRLDDDVAAMAVRVHDGAGEPGRSRAEDLNSERDRAGGGPYVTGSAAS